MGIFSQLDIVKFSPGAPGYALVDSSKLRPKFITTYFDLIGPFLLMVERQKPQEYTTQRATPSTRMFDSIVNTCTQAWCTFVQNSYRALTSSIIFNSHVYLEQEAMQPHHGGREEKKLV